MRPRSIARLPLLYRGLRTQPLYHTKEDPEPSTPSQGWDFNLASPRQLVEYLDGYVVGQHKAKKVLSVGVFNHYNRVRANLEPPSVPPERSDVQWVQNHSQIIDSRPPRYPTLNLQPHPHRRTMSPLSPRLSSPFFEKSNILVIGPTGSGKTLLASTLAKVLDVPFSVSDATTFTQAGYVGDDVDTVIYRLLSAANWDVQRASTGIVYIDEADKLSRRTGGDMQTRDVGGEGVQQGLLRMMEGSVVTIQAKGSDGVPDAPPSGGSTTDGPRRRGMGTPKQDTFHVDTSNILFILSGAFVGLDKIVQRRMTKGSIGFNAPLIPPTSSEGSDEFMPFFTPNGKAADAWDLVEPTDLIQFGLIPEFISRLPTITSLHPLTKADLLRILTEVKGSLVAQYTALFAYSGVDIRFTNPALREICKIAHARGGGARGLRGIMESLLLDAMYEVPGSSVRYVLINEAVVKGAPPLYWSRGDVSAFWQEWAKEEERDAKERDAAHSQAEGA